MRYLARLKAEFSEKRQVGELPKPPKASSVSFVSSPRCRVSEIEARQPADELFAFAPPSDPENDREALEERAAIIAEGCGMEPAQALQEARWQADRERAWRAFLRNARRILDATEGARAGRLDRYHLEAAGRYGEAIARHMAGTMRGWITARAADVGGQ